MTPIQKKALEHIQANLKSFDTYPIYKFLDQNLIVDGIDAKLKKEIMFKIQDELFKVSIPVKDSEKWLEALMSDTK